MEEWEYIGNTAGGVTHFSPVSVKTFHCAVCIKCGSAEIPFRDWEVRSEWMRKHYEGTTHTDFLLFTVERQI
jgi:tRNA A58 N-methylase Trm61